MKERLKIEHIGDSWAVMLFSEITGDWIPVAEWNTEAEAWSDLENWEAIEAAKEAEIEEEGGGSDDTEV
jgi:hypothetical protein